MRYSIISTGTDALTRIPAIRISVRRPYRSGYISSGRKACVLLPERTVGALQNTARNDARFGFSWLISLVQGGNLLLPLVFLRYIVVSLWYGDIIKNILCGLESNTPPGIGITIRKPGGFLSSSHGANLFEVVELPPDNLTDKSSVAFFMTTPFPSVLWLSRSTKKGRNFNSWTVIGSGKVISAQNVAGVRGVCGIAVISFHSKQSGS